MSIRNLLWYAFVAVLSWTVVRTAVDFQHAHHRAPASVSTPDDLPPVGWTEVCEPAAIGMTCHTYPPNDRTWETAVPMPPRLPLRLPSPDDSEGDDR